MLTRSGEFEARHRFGVPHLGRRRETSTLHAMNGSAALFISLTQFNLAHREPSYSPVVTDADALISVR